MRVPDGLGCCACCHARFAERRARTAEYIAALPGHTVYQEQAAAKVGWTDGLVKSLCENDAPLAQRWPVRGTKGAWEAGCVGESPATRDRRGGAGVGGRLGQLLTAPLQRIGADPVPKRHPGRRKELVQGRGANQGRGRHTTARRRLFGEEPVRTASRPSGQQGRQSSIRARETPGEDLLR
jgi:hypothetical protein